MHSSFLALGMPAGADWIVIAIIGLLLFGKRLPEVGRSIGKTIVEFKKGMKEVETEIHQEEPAPTPLPPQQARPVIPQAQNQGYKFDPYTGKPIEEGIASGSRNDPPAA